MSTAFCASPEVSQCGLSAWIAEPPLLVKVPCGSRWSGVSAAPLLLLFRASTGGLLFKQTGVALLLGGIGRSTAAQGGNGRIVSTR